MEKHRTTTDGNIAFVMVGVVVVAIVIIAALTVTAILSGPPAL